MELQSVLQSMDSMAAARAAVITNAEWQAAINITVQALDMTTARMWRADEVVDALNQVIDHASGWMRENLDHIRQYFVLAPKADWSHCDLLIALTRLQAQASADPMEWEPVASQRGEAR